MGNSYKLDKIKLDKNETLTKLEAVEVYSAIKKANPNIKKDILKLKEELISGLSRHDRKSGTWFANVYKKVVDNRGKSITLESLEAAYNTKDKELIARKLMAYYCNYGISIGAVLGSSGGILGLFTAHYATFEELTCLAYFQICLLYDLSVLYCRPIDRANNLEIYRLLKIAFGFNVHELNDKGMRVIEDKLLKDDSQKFLYGLLKNLGAAIVRSSVKNLVSKMVPVVGTIIALIVCTAEDYKAVRIVAKRSLRFYNNYENMGAFKI
jgi:hypothetical protein